MTVISLVMMTAAMLLVAPGRARCRVLVQETGVSIYSKPVYVKGPENVAVDGYPAKLGLPGKTQDTPELQKGEYKEEESYDSFVASSSIDNRIAPATSSLGFQVQGSEKEPYRTPYIPPQSATMHKQVHL